jgi:hypothetical protein
MGRRRPMTTRDEFVERLTREGEHEVAAHVAAMTDDEYTACEARAQKIADVFINDPLMWLELEDELGIHGAAREMNGDYDNE